MKAILTFALLISTLAGCAIVPFGYGDRDGYYRGHGYYRDRDYRGYYWRDDDRGRYSGGAYFRDADRGQ